MERMAERDLEALRQDDESLREDHAKERAILGRIVEYAQLLVKEVRALGAEMEAQMLEIVRSICKVAMDPRYVTEEETAMALTDAVRDMRPLLDDMFVEADFVFSQPSPRAKPPRSPRKNKTTIPSPRTGATPVSGPRKMVTRETRDEDNRGGSAINTSPAIATTQDGKYLEITQQEVSELKQTLIAGRTAAAKEPKPGRTVDTSDAFEKEMENFHAELAKPLSTSPSKASAKGIVGRQKNFFSQGTPLSSREPSEVSGNNSSIGSGSVKRLAGFFLSGTPTTQKATMDVNTQASQELSKFSTPQSRMSRNGFEWN